MGPRRTPSTLSALFARRADDWSQLARDTVAALVPTGLDAAAHPHHGMPAGPGLEGVAQAGGSTRRYWLHRPATATADARWPLLVMLHGCGQGARQLAAATRMNALADREHFLVLYLEQDLGANAQGCWNWFDTRAGRAQVEADIVLDTIDQACDRHGADPRRVAVAGLSAGGCLAALVASRHPRRVHAVAMHAGIAPGVAHSSATALAAMQGRRPVPLTALTGPGLPPLLVIHGDADEVVAPSNAVAAAQAWAHATGAHETPSRDVHRGRRHPMRVTDFRHGSVTRVRLVQVAGLGHAWSGGAPGQLFSEPAGPDASRLIWEFAARQFGG